MPQPKTAGNPRTGRYYLRLPQEIIVEINGYIKESGLYQTHFLSNALVVGARQLAPARQRAAIELASASERRLA